MQALLTFHCPLPILNVAGFLFHQCILAFRHSLWGSVQSRMITEDRFHSFQDVFIDHSSVVCFHCDYVITGSSNQWVTVHHSQLLFTKLKLNSFLQSLCFPLLCPAIMFAFPTSYFLFFSFLPSFILFHFFFNNLPFFFLFSLCSFS